MKMMKLQDLFFGDCVIYSEKTAEGFSYFLKQHFFMQFYVIVLSNPSCCPVDVNLVCRKKDRWPPCTTFYEIKSLLIIARVEDWLPWQIVRCVIMGLWQVSVWLPSLPWQALDHRTSCLAILGRRWCRDTAGVWLWSPLTAYDWCSRCHSIS